MAESIINCIAPNSCELFVDNKIFMWEHYEIKLNIPVKWYRQSGPRKLLKYYSLKVLSIPYISLIEMSLAESALSIFILYASCTMRSRIASANGLESPPSCSYHPSSLYWEQNMVEERFLLLCNSSKIDLHSFSVSFMSRWD